jgi:hypothetical protein
MSENKTNETGRSVDAFLDTIESDKKRTDAFALLDLFKEATGFKAKMWGDAIVGFGSYHYVYESGREGDSALTGFSPRKQKFSIYIMSGFNKYQSMLSEIGKHKTSKVCLYINKLADIDEKILKKMIKQSINHMIESNPQYTFTLE